MEPHSIIAIAATVPLALLLGWQWLGARRAKQIKGGPTPDTSAVDGDVATPRRVYFFHAAHCGHCQAVAPMVDRLRLAYPNLIAVDAAANPGLTHDFGVVGLPSFIAVVDDRIEEVTLGACSETWLRRQLAA